MMNQISLSLTAEQLGKLVGSDLVDGAMILAVKNGNVTIHCGGLPNLQISESSGKMLNAIAETAAMLSAHDGKRIRTTFNWDRDEDEERSGDYETGTHQAAHSEF